MKNRRTRTPRWVSLGIVSLCLMLGYVKMAWAEPTPPAGLAAPSQRASMPSFRLPGVDSDAIDSATLQGKVVVVRFWATW